MKKIIRNFIIGVFILGSFSVQAGRKAPRKCAVFFSPPITQEYLEAGPNRWEDTTFNRAIRSVWGRPGQKGKDPYYETREGKIIRELAYINAVKMAHKLGEWKHGLASETAIEFLERFIYWSQTESVPQAFDNALIDVGAANHANLETVKNRLFHALKRSGNGVINVFRL